MNYFEFFAIPVSFQVDEAQLKRIFYANSKKYHPDFYTLESAEKQEEILELSTLNNKAYKTLKDFDARLKYILEWKGILKEEGQHKVPQDFLMEMMDINEALMDLKMDPNEEQLAKTRAQVENLEKELMDGILPILSSYTGDKEQEEDLKKVLDFYLKRRYLLRIRQDLN
ncbi:MAG: iron-sulfur cluster co-chaperone HscB C-terminal domain-containing protein [Bacteroidota bacterium]